MTIIDNKDKYLFLFCWPDESYREGPERDANHDADDDCQNNPVINSKSLIWLLFTKSVQIKSS
jgi:hypothetical protein